MDAQTAPPKATLAARLLDKDGNLIRDYGVISEDPVPVPKLQETKEQLPDN
jgi:hypothetical protein